MECGPSAVLLLKLLLSLLDSKNKIFTAYYTGASSLSFAFTTEQVSSTVSRLTRIRKVSGSKPCGMPSDLTDVFLVFSSLASRKSRCDTVKYATTTCHMSFEATNVGSLRGVLK